jgi:hypothetical protein
MPNKSATARFLVVNALLLLLSIIVGIVLAVFAVTNRTWAILFSFLSALLLLLVTIALELRVLPTEFRPLRSDIAAATLAAHRNRILALVFDEILRALREQIIALRHGTYTDDKGTIPELSVKTIEAVKRSAFATFVENSTENLYQQPQGRRYLEAWYAKSAELGPAAICRVFILQDPAEVSEDTLTIIREHEANNVRVVVTSRTEAEKLADGCELDFGLFDSECLMAVTSHPRLRTRLDVFVRDETGSNEAIIERYERFRARLLAITLDTGTFLDKFAEPMNVQFYNEWYVNYPARLGPPNGISPVDVTGMVNLVTQHIGRDDSLHVAVLGVTPQLVDALLTTNAVTAVTLIDQTPISFPIKDNRIRRVRANWLTYRSTEKFDAIVGDEALNNLRLAQYGTFFRSMRRLVKDDGILLMRTLGRYSGSARHRSASVEELFRFIQDEGNELTDVDRIARIITFLHSPSIAFDEGHSMIETTRYNALLKGWAERKEISEDTAAKFWFPSKEITALSLSSPDTDQIFQKSRALFHQMPFREVDSDYCGTNGILSTFYRLTTFIPNLEVGEVDL